jgi:GNAT superfamily N-acetyltransferase
MWFAPNAFGIYRRWVIDRRSTIASFIAATLGASSAPVRAAQPKSIAVRSSKIEDIPAMVEMIERRRLRYQSYKPVFWKKAANSAQASLNWFRQMIESGVVAFTAIEDGKVAGFVFANETREPPVVDPGGVTVTLDDYCVVRENRWHDVGLALLNAVKEAGRTRGWRQIVVISAEKDIAKSEFLKASGLSIASTWWTTQL